jgi:hypothetical protein
MLIRVLFGFISWFARAGGTGQTKEIRKTKTVKKSVIYKVSYDFANDGDSELADFAGNVSTSMTGNKSFPTPPVDPTVLGTQVDTYDTDIQAALMGGLMLTAKKDASRGIVLESLRANGYYVQTVASHELEVILSSGYYVISTNRAQSPLDTPAITSIENVAAAQLLVRVTPIDNARSYHVQMSTGTIAWADAGIFPQARRIVLAGLASGTVYNVRVRAIGGSTGTSDWSDPQSHIST